MGKETPPSGPHRHSLISVTSAPIRDHIYSTQNPLLSSILNASLKPHHHLLVLADQATLTSYPSASMPTTRRQAALEESGVDVKSASKSEKPKSSPKKRGTKREVEGVEQPEKPEDGEGPPAKKTKQNAKQGEEMSEPNQGKKNGKDKAEK